jgi:hypothetical protein
MRPICSTPPPQWQGQVATLGPVSVAVAEWLAALDREPAALEAALGSTARPASACMPSC